MRWAGRRGSGNIEDRRGLPAGGMMVGGGLGTVVLIVVALMAGVDPSFLLSGAQSGAPQQEVAPGTPQDEAGQFVAVVLADTEVVWGSLFNQMGRQYEQPRLVLFEQGVQSACGFASAAVGPFYCPADQKVYLDLGFFRELKQRFGAPGDFAQAYVIAHEIGHHVQQLLGVTDQAERARRGMSKSEYNDFSVRMELQADFYAGVWAHHAQRMAQILEPGDIEEALGAATAIGDDKLQMEAQGYVVPESFTHGTAAQRVKWFKRGFETGDVRQGDTFNARDL